MRIDKNGKMIIVTKTGAEVFIHHLSATFNRIVADLYGLFAVQVHNMGVLFFLVAHVVADYFGSGNCFHIRFDLEFTLARIRPFNVRVAMSFSESCHG